MLGTVTEYIKSNGLLFYKEEDSVAPTDSGIYNGFSIQVLNSVIEPVVPVQPVVTLPFEPVFAPKIEINTADQFVFNIEPVEPAPVEIFTAPTIKPPLESVMIGTVIGNDINEICASEERTLLFTSLYDWNRASTWSGLTFYEDSQLNIPVANAKYIKKWMDNNRNIYEISNGLVGKSLGDCIDLIQYTNKLTKLDPKIWGGTIGVSFILGNTLENICSKQKSQNVSDITKLYLEQELWTAYYQNLTGVTLFLDESLKTPYGDGFITTFGLDGLTIYEIDNGIVGKSLGTCSVLIKKPIIELIEPQKELATVQQLHPVDQFVFQQVIEEKPYTVQGGGGFSAGNSIDEICNSNQDPVVIYFKAFNGLGTYGQIGAKLYKDRAVSIPYTDSIYVTRWRARPTQEIMKLDGNGTVIEILSPC
jgi:hypothetical protein